VTSQSGTKGQNPSNAPGPYPHVQHRLPLTTGAGVGGLRRFALVGGDSPLGVFVCCATASDLLSRSFLCLSGTALSRVEPGFESGSGALLKKGFERGTLSRPPGFIVACSQSQRNGKLRPVLYRSPLYAFLRKSRFKMDTPALVRSSIRRGDWASSVDLPTRTVTWESFPEIGNGYASCG
jgi:hypothetical protein